MYGCDVTKHDRRCCLQASFDLCHSLTDQGSFCHFHIVLSNFTKTEWSEKENIKKQKIPLKSLTTTARTFEQSASADTNRARIMVGVIRPPNSIKICSSEEESGKDRNFSIALWYKEFSFSHFGRLFVKNNFSCTQGFAELLHGINSLATNNAEKYCSLL